MVHFAGRSPAQTPPPRRARLAFLAIIAGLLPSLAACSSGGDDAATPTTDFVVVNIAAGGVAGPLATTAARQVAGVAAAAAVLNARGGILGRPVKVEVINDGGDPMKAVQLLQRRLGSGVKPDFIIAGTTATETLALLPIATEAGIATSAYGASARLNDPAKFPYHFMVSAPQELLAAELVAYVGSKGMRKLALLTSTDPYGETALAAITAAAPSAGLEIVSATYGPADLDMTGQLDRLRSAKPDALFIAALGAPIGYTLRDRAKIGWTDIPTIGSTTFPVASNLVFGTLLGTPSLQNVLIQVTAIDQFVPASERGSDFTTFYDAVTKQGPLDGAIDQYALAYDMVMLAAHAAQQAGSSTGTNLAKALESLTPANLPKWVCLPAYRFTSSNHGPSGAYPVAAIVSPTSLVDGMVGSP